MRFFRHGFTTARALTLRDFRRDYLEAAELERLAKGFCIVCDHSFHFSVRTSKLEMLDEVEELELVLQHYAITWGVKLFGNESSYKAKWKEWMLRPSTEVPSSDR
jgi:[phosphatase 2A protein]-leucine-carboxy methyltransferase